MAEETNVNQNTANEQPSKTERKMKRSDKSVRSYQFFLIRLGVLLLVLWVLFFFIIGNTFCCIFIKDYFYG